MTSTMKLQTVLVVATLALAAGAAVAKDADRENGKENKGKDAAYEKRGDKWVLANDGISVWFHQTGSGKAKPMLKVFSTDADGNVSGYQFKIKRLCEVNATAESCENAFARINLARADNWNTEVTRDDANETVTIRMTLTDAQGIVGLVFHLDTNASSVKFDVHVANWKWQGTSGALAVPGSSDHALLLEMTYEEKNKDDIAEGDESDGNVTVKDGYVSWAANGTATYAAGQTRTLNVTAFHALDDEENEKEGKIALRFDGPGGYSAMEYDPTLGVASASSGAPPGGGSPVPALATVAAVAAIGAAAFVTVRRFR